MSSLLQSPSTLPVSLENCLLQVNENYKTLASNPMYSDEMAEQNKYNARY
jgi:hypothetical protein